MPRDVYVLPLGGLANSFGNGVVLPFLIIYLHNVRGISLGLAGLAAATQSAVALLSGFLAGTLSDTDRAEARDGRLARRDDGRVRADAEIRGVWQAFAVYTVWGVGSGSFWPSQSTLLAGLAPRNRRSAAFAFQRLTMNLGVAIGGIVAGTIASVGHPRTSRSSSR